MTYFLMLLFVFATLWCIAVGWMDRRLRGLPMSMVDILITNILAAIWASLGTFFFHNMW